MGFAVPEMIATHFHMRHGDRIADLGAGSGHFTKALSRLVGKEGKVFAVEIQRPLAEAITDMVRSQHLSNVESIWGDLEVVGGTKISDKTLDAALLSNTFSMLVEKNETLKECVRILRKGGKLFIIDWKDSLRNMGPRADMILAPEAVREMAEKAGFTFERDFPAGEHHYGLAFRL